MKYLVHCILRNRMEPAQAISEAGVRLVASENLAAAVSPCEPKTAAPETSRLLAYESVISALHASGSVIPLRYGCLVENECDIERLLDERRAGYEALLERLEGRVEMGLRVLWEQEESRATPTPATPGAAYLASIRRRRSNAAELNEAEREWAGRLCATLAGLYSEKRSEMRPAAPGRVVSLYFLVPRAAVERFRGRLRRIVSKEGRRFLVSGPWPPYNFVTPEAQPDSSRSASA